GEVFGANTLRHLRREPCVLRHGMDCGEANLLGKSEIHNFGVAPAGNENVGRLDVAVNDSLAVSSVERVRNLDAEVKEQLQVQRAARDAMLKSLTIEAFHR